MRKMKRQRCNELCTKPSRGSCMVCDALDDAECFVRRWFYGGWLWEALTWLIRPFNDSFRILELAAILIAVSAFFLDLDNRREGREARAWQLIATEEVGNSGKIWALEYLNSEEAWSFLPTWWPWLSITGPPLRLDITTVALGDRGKILADDRGPRPLFLPRRWPLNKGRIPLERIDLTPRGVLLEESEPTGLTCTSEHRRVLSWEPCITRLRTHLRGVQLSEAQLRFAALPCADLRGASLRGADLRKADLRGAMLGEIRLSGEALEILRSASPSLFESEENPEGEAPRVLIELLRDAFAKLRPNSWLADLQDADLRYADLRGAHLGSVNLQSANLKDARLCGAYLFGADIREAKGIGCEELQDTLGWQFALRDKNLLCKASSSPRDNK